MYHHLYFQSILILILLNFSCYSTPISYVDQNDQDQTSSLIHLDEENMIKQNKNDQLYYYNILCALYNDCYNKDQQDIIYTDVKPKRLTSNLFHGIPKFGKRAFTSAFSGIPKFG
jgi:hypothetical protein